MDVVEEGPAASRPRPRPGRPPRSAEQRDHLKAVYEELAKAGIQLDTELLDATIIALRPIPIVDLLRPGTAENAVEAVWGSLFNKHSGTPAIVATTAVREVLRIGKARLASRFQQIKWDPTWCFVHVFLAGLHYERGKTLLVAKEHEQARTAFGAALDYWPIVEAYDGLLKGKTSYIWRGMRAETQLILARQNQQPIPLLQRAREDYRLAEARGDASPEHFCYRLEVLGRLTAAGVAVAAEEIAEVTEAGMLHAGGRREWFANIADLELYQGQQALAPWTSITEGVAGEDAGATTGKDDAGENTDELIEPAHRAAIEVALQHIRAAIGYYTDALAVPAMSDSPDGLMRAKRGLASQRLMYLNRQLGEPWVELLDGVIDDLRACAEPGARLRGLALPSALLTKTMLLRKEKDLLGAAACAEEGHAYCARHPDEVPDLQRRSLLMLARIGRLERVLATDFPVLPSAGRGPDGRDPDLTGIRKLIAEVMQIAPECDKSAGSLTRASWVLLTASDVDPVDLEMVEKISGILDAERERQPNTDSRAWLASQLGWIAVRLLRVTGEASAVYDKDARSELLRRAYRYFSTAVEDSSAPSAQLLGALARTSMLLGKECLAEGSDVSQGIEFLNEARACFEESIATESAVDGEENGQAQASEETAWMTASLLGETCLRLHAVLREPEYVDGAIEWLSRSIEQGNATPQAVGLLGDAYYRRGRDQYPLDSADLRTALAYKEEARRKGGLNRENLSVSAAVHEALWRRHGAPEDHSAAVHLAARAHLVDPAWPWPLLQLAELAAAQPSGPNPGPRTAQEAPAEAGLRTVDLEELVRLVYARDTGRLRHASAEAALRTRAFQRSVLGGRSATFVLDDPHRLLSATLVLKPGTAAAAEEEERRLGSLRTHLTATGAPPWMLVPECFARVPLPGDRLEDAPGGAAFRAAAPVDTALAVRRAAGRSLAELISARQPVSGRQPMPYAERAARFLARIHHWSGGDGEQDGEHACAAIADTMRKYLGRLQFPEPEPVIATWLKALPDRFRLVTGRDAHAENWLVTRDGKIVALDLEEHPRLPALYEVVQLIDDHPLVASTGNPAAWHDRLQICRAYLDECRRIGLAFEIDEARLRSLYRSFLFVRAVFVCGFVPGKIDRMESSGSLRFATERIRHALRLLEWLAGEESDPQLRAMIVAVRGQAQTAVQPHLT
ncbi:hypothetical protein [Actinomadura sp. 6K520]|uniref:hypothetical protein n=1 Tax=Actinomadura sp. 6K520 TaxID=2530364 RepID=UPI0010528E41|nr:hypothetical protein [Actinomadura sp. 6K520]TDE37758.1 hypothetical protein E1289_03280 [Actinomadura sp. 6K520]